MEFKLKEREMIYAFIAIGGLLVILLSLIAYQYVVPEQKEEQPTTQSSLPMQESYRNNQVAQKRCRDITSQKFFEYGESIYSWQVDYNSSFYDELRDEFMVFFDLIIIDGQGEQVDNWSSCRMRALDYQIIEFQSKKR